MGRPSEQYDSSGVPDRATVERQYFAVLDAFELISGCAAAGTFTGGPKVPASTRTALSETSLYAKQSLHMY
jgi:hypothetical protein